MKHQKVFNATEARQRFFELLQMVEDGHEPLILKKNRNLIFTLSLIKADKKTDKAAVLKEMSHIKIQSKTPDQIKKIINTKLDI